MERLLLTTLCGGLVIIISLLHGGLPARADHGGCPRYDNTPYERRTPQPSIISVSEPAQRAIILWNGQEEILFLSTDLSHSTSGVMSEVIPFPSEPSAKLGNLEVFWSLSRLGSRHGVSLTDLIPRAPTGSLTNIAIGTTAAMKDRFWGTDSARLFTKSDLDYGRTLVQKIQARDYGWVAYDDVGLQEYLQSFPPVEYRFASSRVFYPMEISVNNHGFTQIDLVIITPERLTQFAETDYVILPVSTFKTSSAELSVLSPEWARFMGPQPVSVLHLRIAGDIRTLSKDLLAR